MPEGWQYVIHQSALEALESLPGTERRRVRRCIECLLADPHQRPDAERRTVRERTLSIKYVGRSCVVYWLDAYVRELRIVAVESLNKSR